MSRLKDKIAALRAKTRANGCSEAEALAAAELAARLMRDHGLADEDLVMSEAAATEKTTKATWRTTLSSTIAYCTNTAPILLVGGATNTTFLFIGRAPGPEIALYLRDVCFRAIEGELKRYKASLFYKRRRSVATRRAAAADFVAGLVIHLQKRLRELFAPTVDAAACQEAKNALARRFDTSVTIRPPTRKPRFSDAVVEGWAAGGKVALNHGVATPETLRLGHGTT